jgi:hypothetical protein
MERAIETVKTVLVMAVEDENWRLVRQLTRLIESLELRELEKNPSFLKRAEDL